MASSISPSRASIRSIRSSKSCARPCRRSACRCVSLEVELGPSQYEFTFAPEHGLAAADTMVLFRSAMKQVARRHGHLVSFMCRPRLPNTFASGWHLHQSLLDRKSGKNLFVSNDKTELLSPLGRHYLAGLLAHARAAAAFTTPTVNGYKRYHGVNSMAPIQAIWAQGQSRRDDPRAGRAGRSVDASGEPRRRAARQSVSLHGVADPRGPRRHRAQAHARAVRRFTLRDFAPSRCRSRSPRRWPRSNDSACFRAGFGDVFVDYHLAHQARRDRALRRRDRAGRPATRPMSPRGSTRNISIWPDEGRAISLCFWSF